jgi:hypothetical protein
MAKKVQVGTPPQPAVVQIAAAAPESPAVVSSPHPAHPATPKVGPKKRKVFFNTVDGLQRKKADYESKLASLQGKACKRKRMNTLKVIMQINRAIKNQEACVKDPAELAQKRHKDRLKRVAKKLEKKRMREIVQNVREEEKYGVSHSSLQAHPK